MKPTEAQIDALRQRHIGGHIQDGGDAINYEHGLVDGYIDGLEEPEREIEKLKIWVKILRQRLNDYDQNIDD